MSNKIIISVTMTNGTTHYFLHTDEKPLAAMHSNLTDYRDIQTMENIIGTKITFTMDSVVEMHHVNNLADIRLIISALDTMSTSLVHLPPELTDQLTKFKDSILACRATIVKYAKNNFSLGKIDG